ncbi:MAG: helix-turn-helix domain-containing protein [Roseateles sp.]
MTRARDFERGDRVIETIPIAGCIPGTRKKERRGTVKHIERKTVKVLFDGDREALRVIPNRLKLVPLAMPGTGAVEVEGTLSVTEVVPSLIHTSGFTERTTPVAQMVRIPPCGDCGSDVDVDGICPRCLLTIARDLRDVPVVREAIKKSQRIQTGAPSTETAAPEAAPEPEPAAEAGTASEDDHMTEEERNHEAALDLADEALKSIDTVLDLGDELTPALEEKREKIRQDIIRLENIIDGQQGELDRIESVLAIIAVSGRNQRDRDQSEARDRSSDAPTADNVTALRQPQIPRADIVIGGRDHVTLERACAMVGCGKSTIYRKAREGELTRSNKGGTAYFPIAELERIVLRQRRGR